MKTGRVLREAVRAPSKLETTTGRHLVICKQATCYSTVLNTVAHHWHGADIIVASGHVRNSQKNIM